MNQVYEKYEFKGWLITISNWMGSDELYGFATPTKYSHILNYENYWDIDEIAEENGIKKKYIEDEIDFFYEDFKCLVAEPDDVVVYHLAGVNTCNASSVLDYMVKLIINEINPHGDSFFYPSSHGFHEKYQIVVLKEKKTIVKKVSKKNRGFLHMAWAAMVKERDKKCTECSSIFNLHAHHLKSYKKHPELAYDLNNGITLCDNCHRQWHKINGR